MESFLKKFFPEVYNKMKGDTKISNYCKFDSQLLTSFTSSLYVAGLIASFFASPITKAFGRKPSILIGGAAFLGGAALGGAAYNIYMLIIGRILLGVGVGFANQVPILVFPLFLNIQNLKVDSKMRKTYTISFYPQTRFIYMLVNFLTSLFLSSVSTTISLRNGTTPIQRSNEHWLPILCWHWCFIS